jgi:hypothetical protein
VTELVFEKKKVKAVLFENKVEIVNERLWELNKGKWVVGMVLKGVDCVWKFVGARNGLQEVGEYGDGFERWYWRGSAVQSRVSSRVPTGGSRVRVRRMRLFDSGEEVGSEDINVTFFL